MTPQPGTGRPGAPRLGWPVWAAVAAGAFAGAEARYGLLQVFAPEPGSVDWATLGINAGASLALGFLTSWWLSRPQTPFWLKAGLGPGFLGSFSTFSALALSLELPLSAGRHGVWISSLTLSLAGGLAAAAAGLWLGSRAGAAAAVRRRSVRRHPGDVS
ncbi:CrcB family protein [Arthrobacter sp. zg-Y820]|uniref:fluoride efflux transporter FluC n=1 Tax=unclassified Arthrobacter TaxID=235627 RepID=UPI001E636143|nr:MULTISPECIES: CrcB family protein [unclassified Arthrobacter]MCC9196039.1 CrcB family protein [Arthrobacter sp. zg-Y820]MDK1278898.1 CrcB family protein [Arthrobacter sp. zg.Y820]WIB08687.1 CrcB family protein [Arthrobacter sp. zg-Y820]